MINIVAESDTRGRVMVQVDGAEAVEACPITRQQAAPFDIFARSLNFDELPN